MTMEERFVQRTTPERFSTVIYTTLGFLGLVLAAIGIYGVLAFSVNQRLREIGIRSAMGAQPGQLRAMVMASALRLTAAGLAIGLVGSLALTKLLSSQLYQISPRDPVSLVFALVCLAIIAFLSSYFPAQRAARIDSVTARSMSRIPEAGSSSSRFALSPTLAICATSSRMVAAPAPEAAW